METFILSTLDLPIKEFISTIKKSAVVSLRRTLQDNPYSTYLRWKHSRQKNKPKFITFNSARKAPEIIKDHFGKRFVVLSAIRTNENFFLPMGILESLYLDRKNKGTKKYILTKELACLLKENRFYPHKILHLLPFNEQTLASLRSELGYNTYADRNTWLAQHIEEILNSTAKDFCLKYSDMKIKKNVIADIKTNAKHVFLALENNPSLAEMLLENWEEPSETLRKKLDDLLTAPKSKKTRRTFLILKEAELI